MSLITIDTKRCDMDGICAAICPAGLIQFSKENGPQPVADIEKICIACGHCVAVCPQGCLSHEWVPLDQCPPVDSGLRLTPLQVAQFLRSRRSIRTYRKKAVPRKTMQELIELARYAPSGHNSQGVQWLVVDKRSELDRFIAGTIDWMKWMIAEMPDFAQSIHMDRAVERYENGRDVILRGALPWSLPMHPKTT